jgi:cell division protein FtsZ
VQIFALNTDIKTLRKMTDISNVYLLGKKMLRGAGSGGDPEIAKVAIQDDKEAIKSVLKDTDLLFIIAGLGKGTGSGASPEIAKIAKELGILTVAIVNFPSINSEGATIYKNALEHFNTLKNNVDSITYISNDRIIGSSKNAISFIDAFNQANNEVTYMISQIVDLITSASEMNVDYSDIKNFFKHNKNFFANSATIKEDYSRDNLKQHIRKSLFDSNSDFNVDLENVNVLANFTISPNTPATIVADTRNIFKELIDNQNLTMISGIDYNGKDGIKIMYMLSSGEQHFDSKSREIDEYETKFNKEDNKSQHNYLNDILNDTKTVNLDDYKTNKTLHNTSIGIERQSILSNDDELEEETASKNELDSTKAIELITKAMNNIVIKKDDIQDNKLNN